MKDINALIYALTSCANVQSGYLDHVYICPVCLYGRKDGMPCESLHELLNDAADALKAQQPRVLTLEEVREKKPFVLWVEDIYTGARVFPVAYIKGIYQDSALDWIVDIDAPVEEYNVSWRFWTLYPTYEQRSKTLWPILK